MTRATRAKGQNGQMQDSATYRLSTTVQLPRTTRAHVTMGSTPPIGTQLDAHKSSKLLIFLYIKICAEVALSEVFILLAAKEALLSKEQAFHLSHRTMSSDDAPHPRCLQLGMCPANRNHLSNHLRVLVCLCPRAPVTCVCEDPPCLVVEAPDELAAPGTPTPK